MWYNLWQMKSASLKLPFDYIDSPERRVLSLVKEGFPCIPVLGMSRYGKSRPFLDVHRHPECIEISICLRAPLVFKCEGKTYRLMPGQAFVTQPKDMHHLITNPKGLFLYWMFFRLPPNGKRVLGLPADESRSLVNDLIRIPHRLFGVHPSVRSHFAKLFEIYDSNLDSSRRRLRFRITLLSLLQSLVSAAQEVSPLSIDKRIYTIVNEIKENPARKISVPELAAKAFMSESAFNIRVKKQTGYPPHAYITKCKLDAIKEQLVSTAKPISLIADEFGYSSSQHLAKQFRASFGITMREVRTTGHPLPRIIPNPAIKNGKELEWIKGSEQIDVVSLI